MKLSHKNIKNFISVQPLSNKFYAKHDQFDPDYQHFMGYVQKTQTKRRSKTNCLLSSQIYGWNPQENIINTKSLSELNFVAAPKQRCDMTEFGEYLISERVTERPEFYGLRFYTNFRPSKVKQ